MVFCSEDWQFSTTAASQYLTWSSSYPSHHATQPITNVLTRGNLDNPFEMSGTNVDAEQGTPDVLVVPRTYSASAELEPFMG